MNSCETKEDFGGRRHGVIGCNGCEFKEEMRDQWKKTLDILLKK